MANDWGVFEEQDDAGKFFAYHIVPMVDLDGESAMSAAHTLEQNCACQPIFDKTKSGRKLVAHHDPDHPGAMTEDEWMEKRKAAKK